ncbi:FhaA domain-containing protein [Nitriliruptor alkaliphilus]|uniref:FhaA domain-containing protein n=1 Tax=Nitriliruptor alkaliphilus TaxID=427918 RepID=UPI0006965EAA|nr:DUF3662 and FHA domain-containing protein [Nitriliruptor alkaliphilus]
MGVLQDFEKRLEGAVEGFFARAFRSGLQPLELAKAVQRYAEDHQHVTADGVVVPNVYRVQVSEKDHERLSTFGASLPRELGEVVVNTAADRGWSLRGPVKIRVEASEQVRVGRYQLAGRVEAVGDAPARSRPATAAGSAPGGAERSSDDRAAIDRTMVVGAVPRAQVQLRVVSGVPATSEPVTGSRFVIGRLPSCGLTLDDTTVSREHAALVRRGDAWWVVDLGSTNGTKVNGRRAAEQPVSLGDRLELGDVVLELVGG